MEPLNASEAIRRVMLAHGMSQDDMAMWMQLWNQAELLEATQLQALGAFTEQLLNSPQTATEFWVRLAVIEAVITPESSVNNKTAVESAAHRSKPRRD